jgi:hypothetical protein
MLVVHQGEKPGAKIAAGGPEVLLGKRARQGILDKIIGAVHVADQRSRVTPQLGDLGFK